MQTQVKMFTLTPAKTSQFSR